MAAGGNSDNIPLGVGRLYVAPLGTAEPTSASAAMPSAWRAVGYTEDGSAFSTSATNEPIEVAEEVDPVLYALARRDNTLAFTMVEITRQNLALALGDAANASAGAFAANDGTALEPPTAGSETAVMIVWDSEDDATNGENRRWLFRQCKPGGTIELPRRKAPSKATIAVTFNLEVPAGLKPWKAFPNADGVV